MAKTVMIGSARIDENGKAHGGKAGDQKNGREVSTQAWYLHSKGWRVFRLKDPANAEKVAAAMEWACESDLIGYDQYQRNTLYNELKKYAFEKHYLSKAVETDCSALIRVCLAFAGIDVPADFYTGGMAKQMLATGEIIELTGSKYTDSPDYLGRGDILVTRTKGHTVAVLTNGEKYEGAVEVKPKEFGVDILRKGDEGEAVRLMQDYLIKLGYDLGSRGADGDFGSKTETALEAFQIDKKLLVDGEFGAKSHAAMMAAIDALDDVPVIVPEPIGDLTVKDGSWRIRTGPGTAYPTAGYVKGGEKLTSIDPGKWAPVLYKGEICWISRDGLEG